MEKIIQSINPKYSTIIEKLRKFEKEYEWYEKNCLIKINYNLEKNLENYKDKIIEGESSLDIILEQIERSNSLFDILSEIFEELQKLL